MRKQIVEKERELETLSNNRERLRNRQSSRGSANGRSDQALRGGPSEDLMRSATSGAAFSYKRENSQRGNSYKRDSNSPLRSKERVADTIGSNNVGMRTVGVNELDQKFRDKTPPTRLVQEPVRDY